MLISNFNLNKPEWLELVFAKRNKEYGAYYIRQHYNENVNKAMIITFGAVAVLSIASMAFRNKVVPIYKITEIPQLHTIKPPEPIHKAEIQKSKPAAPKAPASKMIQFLPPVPTAYVPKVDPPSISKMETEVVGPETIDIPGGKDVGQPIPVSNGGGGNQPKVESNEPYDPYGVDVMPEPYGGAAAWAKFLQKNLRYPAAAMENNITGKVFVSFIIEKDGTLSSITILRGLGYGTEEEALRVLKKAPAWKPGKQNGQSVRVKYTLPLNFVLDSQ